MTDQQITPRVLDVTYRVLEVVARRKVFDILIDLGRGVKRYNELARSSQIGSQQLSRILNQLIDIELIERRVQAETRPVQVHYGLTRKGRTVLAWLEDLNESFRQ